MLDGADSLGPEDIEHTATAGVGVLPLFPDALLEGVGFFSSFFSILQELKQQNQQRAKSKNQLNDSSKTSDPEV